MSKNVNQIAPTCATEREQHYKKITYFLSNETLIEYQIQLHAADKHNIQPRKIDIPIEYNVAKNIYTAIQSAKKELSPIELNVLYSVQHKKTFRYIGEIEGIGTSTAYDVYNKIVNFFVFYMLRSENTALSFVKLNVGIDTYKN